MFLPVRWIRTVFFIGRCWWESHRHRRKLRQLLNDVSLSASPIPDDANPVLFFNASTRTWGLTQNAAFSLLLSWGLRLSGIPVRYLVCMRGMQQCMLGTKRTHLSASPPCRSCTRISRHMFPKALMLPIEPPKETWADFHAFDQQPSLESLRSVEYGQLKIGELCFPSLAWALRRNTLPDTPAVRNLYRRYLRSAINIAQSVETYFEETRPRAVVLFNGVTFPEAIVKQMAKRKGIPVLTHEVGVQPSSVFFTHGEATAYPIEIGSDFKLTPEETARLDDYLSRRFRGDFSMAAVRFWPDIRALDADLLEKIDRFSETVAVFTNVIFDTSQVHANVIFRDMFDWLEQVVGYAKEHPQTLFVIRAHPDELRPGKEAQETVEDKLRQVGALSLANIVFVPPREFVSSYELIRRSKLVLVYNSSIGLEATLLNRVVLCGGASRYSRYRTAYFPQDKEEYFRLADQFLGQEQPRPPEIFIEEAKKFSYVQHFLSSLDFSDYFINQPDLPGYVVLKDFDPMALHPDRSREIAILRQGILENQPILYDRRDVPPLETLRVR